MSGAEVVSYVAWASASFTGAQVTMTGTPFEDESEINIGTAFVADVRRRPSGEVDLLIVCSADRDPATDQRAISDHLCAAAEAALSTPRDKQCNRCRFWLEDMRHRDPQDADFGFGSCRLKPPIVIDALVTVQIDRPRWGSGEVFDDIVDTTSLARASRHPMTFATDWCGEFKPMKEGR